MSEPKHAIEMTFCGATAAEVTKHIVEFATLHGSPLANAETEALVKELRDRLAKNGQVVKIVPFANEECFSAEGSVEASSTQPRGRGRPRKSAAEEAPKASPEPVEPTPDIPDAIEQAEKTIADNLPPTASANAEIVVAPVGDSAVIVSVAAIEDVKKALNVFAALYGQVEARTVMKDSGGASALKDVAAEKYQAVIDGLAAKTAELASRKQAA